MSLYERGVPGGDCIAGSAFDRRPSSLRKTRHIAILSLSALLTTAVYSQSIGNNDGGTSPTSQDCADPLLAATSQCTGQNQQDFNPNLSPNQGSANFSGSPQARAMTLPANGNYTDIEQLSHQSGARNQPRAVLPSEPPTEFQTFITSTTGQNLPIYGASLFDNVPSTFAPLDLTPVPPEYVLGPGDELRIRVWGQVNFAVNVRVDRSGDVFLPQIGPVHIAGMQSSEIDAHLRSAIGRVYHNFDLTADVGQIRAIQVYVSGQARRPGVYTVSSLSTLVDALFNSGGPSVQGSMRHIQLRRGSAIVTDFDLYGLLIDGDKSKDVKLQSGDVIFIPPVGPQAAVTGSVKHPAIFELLANESLAGLLTDAGGLSSVAAEARVSIERIEEHRDRHAMEVAYDAAGLATPLTDGDLVRVYSIVPLYKKTIILRGNTANPGRFAWHAGMRISDLIPDKESLVTRNYWWKRARLGLPAPEEVDAPTQPETQGSRYSSQNQGQNPNQSQNQNQSQSQGQYQSLSQNPNAQQRTGGSSLAAAETSAENNRLIAPSQRTVIRELAPEIDWDYAVIERLDPDTLKAVIIPFDLGKLVLQHDASQDIELEPGDVVSIFSQADFKVPIAHQTKQVKLDGEFAHAGVYTVQPGETLRQLVERAGGITPNAYLFGSEFSRETTRAVQQARIDEYVQSLGMQIQRSNLALAASSVGSPQDLASGAAGQAGERDLLTSLRQIRATGRIVLRFTPEDDNVRNIPDLTLEDGDTFMAPPVPASVNVVGAVYDQNSFLYTRGARVATYLRYAGGANRDGDHAHEFIIRADGEVVSRNRNKGLWANDFDNLPLYPGDTIVVPEKTYKPSALRGVMEWSQMFSQFALGAASLSILP